MDTSAQNNLANNKKELHTRIRRNVETLDQILRKRTLFEEDLRCFHSTCNDLTIDLNEFEASPKLLDTGLRCYMKKVSEAYLYLKTSQQNDQACPLTSRLATICYTIGKIRGFKTIVNYLYCGIDVIFPLLNLMQKSEILTVDEVLLLLLWLSNLALAPFVLNSIDKNLEKELFRIGLTNLTRHSNGSKNQAVSLILLSNLLTRPDTIEHGLLDRYLRAYAIPNWTDDLAPYSVRLGHSQTINKILKKCPLNVSLGYWQLVYENIMLIDISNLRLQEEKNSIVLTNLNLLYMIKIFHKLAQVALIQVKPLKFQKVSNIINHLLHDVVLPLILKFDTNLRYATAKCLSHICVSLSSEASNYQEQLILYLTDQFEFEGFSSYPHGSTGCYIFQPHLSLHNQDFSLAKFHLILLTIGFVSLKRSLPFTLLPLFFSIVHKTLFILQKRVNVFHGSQLRDSSCFILWAIFRQILLPQFECLDQRNPGMIDTIFFDLVRIISFDSDLIVRKCGLAVLQEFVGRFGTLFFSQKLDCVEKGNNYVGSFILTLMDVLRNTSLDPCQSSYCLMKELLCLGFNGSLFVPDLILSIENEDTGFQIKKLRIYELLSLLKEKSGRQYELDISPIPDFTICCSEDSLLERYRYNLLDSDWALYLFSELSTTRDPSITDALLILSYLDSLFKYDPCIDSVHRAEGYMKWISYCLYTFPSNYFELNWDIVSSISESIPNADLLKEFKRFFRNLSNSWNSFLVEKLEEFIGRIYNNNILIAGSLFSFLHLKADQITRMVNAMSNSQKIEIGVKVKLVESLSENMPFHRLGFGHLLSLSNLLDDYTVTDQGDVGSKVRLAVLEMIASNFEVFEREHGIVEKKLIRLCGEINRKVCLKSFEVLLKIKHNLCFNTSGNYYAMLFEYYDSQILGERFQLNRRHMDGFSLSFWSGLVLSLGSLSASKDELNESFDQLLSFLIKSNDALRAYVYQGLLDTLRIPREVLFNDLHVHQVKRFVAALNVFVKLYESNAPFPSYFNENLLFVRSYNLHINTTSLVRLKLVMKIFLQLSLYSRSKDVRAKARNRLCWLACFPKSNNIRSEAIENICDLVNEREPKHLNLELQKNYFSDQKTLISNFNKFQNFVLEL